MASLDDADAVMKKLGVESLEILTQEQLYALGLELPEVSEELRGKLIETVPGLRTFLLDALGYQEKLAEKNVDARTAESKHVHDAYADARSIIKGELSREDLSEERRQALLDEALKTADKQAAFAAENGAANERALRGVNSAGVKYAIIATSTLFAIAGVRAVITRLR